MPTEHTLEKHGLTRQQWQAIKKTQGGLCGLCNGKLSAKGVSYDSGRLVHTRCPGRFAYRAALIAKTEAELGPDMRLCGHCRLPTKLSDFPKGKKQRNGQQRYNYCLQCHSEDQRRRKLQKFYSLTIADYDVMLAAQQGLCAICKQPPRSMRLAVDHDHTTGLIRGLLCSFCNRSLSVFRDSAERLRTAAMYLETPPAPPALGAPRFGIKGRTSNRAATRERLNKLNHLI